VTYDISDEQARRGLSDRDLVALARQAQDPAAREASLHEIYRRHGESVIRSCVRYFTDLDRVRDAAAAAFEIAIHELTDGPNPPREPDKLRAWLRGHRQEPMSAIMKFPRLEGLAVR
jgi:hypothetical protein